MHGDLQLAVRGIHSLTDLLAPQGISAGVGQATDDTLAANAPATGDEDIDNASTDDNGEEQAERSDDEQANFLDLGEMTVAQITSKWHQAPYKLICDTRTASLSNSGPTSLWDELLTKVSKIEWNRAAKTMFGTIAHRQPIGFKSADEMLEIFSRVGDVDTMRSLEEGFRLRRENEERCVLGVEQSAIDPTGLRGLTVLLRDTELEDLDALGMARARRLLAMFANKYAEVSISFTQDESRSCLISDHEFFTNSAEIASITYKGFGYKKAVNKYMARTLLASDEPGIGRKELAYHVLTIEDWVRRGNYYEKWINKFGKGVLLFLAQTDDDTVGDIPSKALDQFFEASKRLCPDLDTVADKATEFWNQYEKHDFFIEPKPGKAPQMLTIEALRDLNKVDIVPTPTRLFLPLLGRHALELGLPVSAGRAVKLVPGAGRKRKVGE